jgi:hypothetical protein
MAEAQGGRLTCTSEVGVGSRFVLELPVAPGRGARPWRLTAVDPSAVEPT